MFRAAPSAGRVRFSAVAEQQQRPGAAHATLERGVDH